MAERRLESVFLVDPDAINGREKHRSDFVALGRPRQHARGLVDEISGALEAQDRHQLPKGLAFEPRGDHAQQRAERKWREDEVLRQALALGVVFDEDSPDDLHAQIVHGVSDSEIRGLGFVDEEEEEEERWVLVLEFVVCLSFADGNEKLL